ncbi:hypothetical protein DVH05_014307 [Phytophthora capsici]|nr:hypothetical protein DVH05_014307 [Phytophthora capsici]
MGDYCISLNHGSTEDGVRITTDLCKDEVKQYQQWRFDAEDGTMRSMASSVDQCVTAGYACVQASAFMTPEDRKVMNENKEPADFGWWGGFGGDDAKRFHPDFHLGVSGHNYNCKTSK